ncbi:MAG TPA: enoyl-CoA hydratase/isomerase family protein [Myxococcota bacterium]
MAPDEVRVHTLAEAIGRLRTPDAAEAFGPLGDERLLAVDVESGGPTLPGSADALRTRLARLPCPTVALARGGAHGAVAKRWAQAFDVVVESEEELARVADTAARVPIAAATCAQLLRLGAWRDLEAGLVAESLAYATLQAGPEFAAWLEARRAAHPPRTDPAEPPPVRIARDGDRLHVTLDRPARRNAFSAAMRDALIEALALAAADASLREVQLDGAGPAFCAGGDLDEFGTRPDPATAHVVRTTRSAARALAALAPRVVAVVHGACVGAGLELAAFAGRVRVRPDARFQLPELAMGLVPGAGGTVSLPRRIGRHRTAWLALTGSAIDARTALDWGLADEMAPA